MKVKSLLLQSIAQIYDLRLTQLRFTEKDSVRFFWSDEILPHNAVERDGLFDSGETARSVDYTYTFEVGENGTYEYICEPHEAVGMIGTIVVEPLPENQEEPELLPDDKEKLPSHKVQQSIQ